jgi:hydroxymethylpyrimidine/phosphomethylpyrimidine kinase
LGAKAVLLKGGHDDQDPVVDLLATEEGGITEYSAPRLETRHMAGIGSTLSAAIACGMAQGLEVHRAVERGRAYLQACIKDAPGFGHGSGPINHGVSVAPFML